MGRITSLPFDRMGRVELAKFLTKERANSGMTLKQLGVESTLAPETISMMEKAQHSEQTPNVAVWTLVGLADGLNVDPDELFAFSEADREDRPCLGDVDAARSVLTDRKARAKRARQRALAEALAEAEATAAAAAEIEADLPIVVTDYTPPLPLASVPTNVELMQLVRRLTRDEDRLLIAEFIEEVLAG